MDLQMGNTELTDAASPVAMRALGEPELCQHFAEDNLSSIGQMTRRLAHELNNSLSPIVGFSELLLNDPQKRRDPQLLEHWLENIHASANRAAQAVRQLRKLAGQKAEEPTRTSIDLNQLVQQAAVRIKPAWKAPSGESINFAIHCTPIPHILGEVFAISELLNALLANAVAAMPAGGCITISTAADNQFVRLQVSDTRTVMTATVHQNCFEPVFTPTDMPRSGLDLAMAYGIVKRHGGTIAMDSQPDYGTTITLRLPIPPGPATTTGAGRSSS